MVRCEARPAVSEEIVADLEYEVAQPERPQEAVEGEAE